MSEKRKTFAIGDTVELSEYSREAMWDRIEPTETCWIWHGSLDVNGYGKFLGLGAHRVVYERLICKIPAGLELDHLCRNRACVNPAHLEPVTPGENRKRAWAYRPRGKSRALPQGPPATHCKRGHEYTPEDFGSNGRRQCMACKQVWERERHKRRKQARKEAS